MTYSVNEVSEISAKRTVEIHSSPVGPQLPMVNCGIFTNQQLTLAGRLISTVPQLFLSTVEKMAYKSLNSLSFHSSTVRPPKGGVWSVGLAAHSLLPSGPLGRARG